jgi:osmotically-inducible protein OsmY
MVRGNLLLGLGIGAVVTFLADPRAGRRRRALARARAVRATRKTRDALDATVRDLANRTTGIIAETRGRFTDEPMDDRTLVERVRARLGRASSHSHALDVTAADGSVTLRGPILAREVQDVLATVQAVRGVKQVVNELEPHESAAGVPGLQGESRTASPSRDILQRNWSPATQALVTMGLTATGICLAAYARR